MGELEEQNIVLLKEVLDTLESEHVSEVLEFAQDVLKVYYEVYVGTKNYIDYTTFVKFCRDFDIFPSLCNRITLHSAFYTLAFLNNRTTKTTESVISPKPSPGKRSFIKKKGKLNPKESLTLNLFVEALALCAFQSKSFDQSPDLTGRMILLMKRIVQSQGVILVKKTLGKTR